MALSKLHVIHYIESLGIGGGQAMMFELFHAFQRYYPDLEQSIWLANKKCISPDFVKSYGMEYSVVENKMLDACVLHMKGPVILIYHKLMCSKTDAYRRLYKRVPIITINHTYSAGMRFQNISNCDYVVAVSKFMKSKTKRFSPHLGHATIRNGVNADKYDPILADPRGYGPKILLTGRINCLNKIKYSDSWIKWCQELKLPHKMVHEYIGAGFYLKKAKKLVANAHSKGKNRNDIVFHGKVKEFERKVRIMKRWDLFLYEVNRHEGISIAILEALACGVPVICSNHYGNKEIIENGVNGYVFSNREHARQILTRLAKKPYELHELKISTKKHFDENLDARHMAASYVKLIKKLCIKHKWQIKGITDMRPEDISSRIVTPVTISNKETDPSKPNKLFSILTAGRNSARYIHDWSESIFEQEYRPLEVIFVDDASKDKTWQRVLDLYPKFKDADIDLKLVVNDKRMYCGTSYGKAFDEANGFYMGVLDADDMLVPNAVDYIVRVYEANPDITYIYTQFEFVDAKGKRVKRGFCKAPPVGQTLLDLGRKRVHGFSHWRTFSKRHPRLEKIWGRGLKAGIDKFMGYRLEEFGKGMFLDHVCYRYRAGMPGCISKTEAAISEWHNIMSNAEFRRNKYKLKKHSIRVLKPDKE